MKIDTFLLSVMLSLSVAISSYASTQVALVIGNADYHNAPLQNPVNDARDIAKKLQHFGFEVMLKINVDQPAMETAINEFGRQLRQSNVGLFYYSGHGVQYAGQNYLIPIGAMSSLSTAEQLRYKTVNIGYLIGMMKDAGNAMNLVMLDACRDNPFKGFFRNIQRGLARMPGAEGMLIAYATSPGTTAFDGVGRNSPYTKHLLEFMNVPNLPIELLLKKVRAAVKRETKGQQTPWYEASIDGDFYFVQARTPTSTPTPISPMPMPSTPVPRLRRIPQTISQHDAQQRFGLINHQFGWGTGWLPRTYIDNRYEDQGEVVVDDATGLMWQTSGANDPLDYWEAQEYIKKLNHTQFAGYDDWRLPTIPELMSLLESEQQAQGLYLNPMFDTPPEKYWCWSADRVADSSESAWFAGFTYGDVYWLSVKERSYVRAVR